MIKQYCVIGFPVAHSLSPLIHNTLYKRYGLTDCQYIFKEATPDTLDNFLDSIDEANIRGFNITMPLKTFILPHLTYIDFSVLNGCNTVNVTEHGLFGYSTDAMGFYKSLVINGYNYSGNEVVFLGCGGVTRALIKDAIKNGAKKVTVLNRTLSKIADLKDIVLIDDLQNWTNHLENCDILINTTPLGMKHCSSNLDYNQLSKLKKDAVVCDLIYNPPLTPLLQAAADLGHFTLNGLDMLIWQAFYAFDIFFGIMPNMEDYNVIKETILQLE